MARARRYPAELRAAVIAYCIDHGPAEASRHWPDINPATMRSWCSRAGVATVAAERTRAATAAHIARWEERRAGIANQLGATAQQALDRCEQYLADGHMRNAKDAALTLAILVDKAQLLTGGHTARYGTDAERGQALEQGRAHAQGLRAA